MKAKPKNGESNLEYWKRHASKLESICYPSPVSALAKRCAPRLLQLIEAEIAFEEDEEERAWNQHTREIESARVWARRN